jgi:protein-disulfide isomerase
MSRSTKRWVSGIVLTLWPLVAVYAVKQSNWGPILATPKTRQLGDPHARLVIVEYSDFQCPACARVQPTVHSFLELYKGRVRFAFKYYPLTQIHKNAINSAHAAQCATEQNQFWPYQDRLFDTQKQWETLANPTTNYLAIAQEVHLDLDRFTRCYEDPSSLGPIAQDQAEGKQRGIYSTPTFIIGDQRLVGNVFISDGARAIEKALRK